MKSSLHHLYSQNYFFIRHLKPLTEFNSFLLNFYCSHSSCKRLLLNVPRSPLNIQHSPRLDIECTYLKSSPTLWRFAVMMPVSVRESFSSSLLYSIFLVAPIVCSFVRYEQMILKGPWSKFKHRPGLKLWKSWANVQLGLLPCIYKHLNAK